MSLPHERILCRVKVSVIPNCFDFWIDGIDHKLFVQFGGWKNKKLPLRFNNEKMLLATFGMKYFMAGDTWNDYKLLSPEQRVAFQRMFRLLWGAYQIDHNLGSNTLPWETE